ncbi:MAG TPA: hypothetical protein VN827_02605, partial [Chthoniobacterales bacterium]|nr:hypothetical protein [Chthoniobacterales bacterium]
NSNSNPYCYTDSDANCHAYTDPVSDRYSNTNCHSNANCHTYTNSDPDTHAECHTYANADSDTAHYWASGDVEPAAGIDVYFIERDFPMERWQRDGLLPFRRQFATWRRYLQLWPSDSAFENRKQHPYGWAHDLCDARLTG